MTFSFLLYVVFFPPPKSSGLRPWGGSQALAYLESSGVDWVEGVLGSTGLILALCKPIQAGTSPLTHLLSLPPCFMQMLSSFL
jgi:hypothetical protein